MKHTAFIMAILLTFSLTACSMNGKNSSTANNKNPLPSNTSGSVKPGTDKDPDTPIHDNTGKNDADKDVNNKPDDDKNTDTDTDKKPVDDDAADKKDRRFMYAGKLYTVTDEKIGQDKVGAELYSIASMLEGEPEKDGDAVGLDEGVRIFKLVEENEYREVAVELDNEYYLAHVVDTENK